MNTAIKFPVFVDANRRFAVQIDENPRYRRLLTLGPGGAVDVVKFLPYQMKRWSPYDVPNAALQYVHTFARSTLSKTYRAVRAMEEVMQDLDKLTMPELVAEFNRLSGKTVTRFASKAAALKAIRKLTPITNGTTAPEEKPANDEAQPTTKEHDMSASKKTTSKKPAKTTSKKPAKTTSKKPAKTRGVAPKDGIEKAKRICASNKGSGGYIRQMLVAGETDTDKIISKVLKKFPERNTKASDVSWNKSMLMKAGLLK